MAGLDGWSEDEIQEVVRREVGRFADLLIEEVERLGMRADGNLNHRDFRDALVDVRRRFVMGQEVEA